MAVRSKPLTNGTHSVGTASALLYTGTSGETPLLKFVTVCNRHSSSTASVAIARGATAVASDASVFIHATLLPRTTQHFAVFMPLDGNGNVSAIADIASAISVYLYGAELEGVAD